MNLIHAQFLINQSYSEALEELLQYGIENHYLLEDELVGVIIGGFFSKIVPHELKHSSLQKQEPAMINWDQEWSFHAKNFQNGYSTIQLEEYGAKGKIRLEPGPGFGDLSHPTTHLVLSLMAPYVKDQNVVDFGCGSGILSLAAIKMGAKQIVAIDIDPEAIAHCKKNISCNEMEDRISIAQTIPTKKDWTLLLNMTLYDQKSALSVYPDLFSRFTYSVISGILDYQKSHYLNLIGKRPVVEKHFQDWIGLILKNI